MASYATVPAESDLESEATLLNSKPKPKSSLIVGGVAAAAFVLGIIAATAVRSSPAVGVKTQLSRKTDKCFITPGCTDKQGLSLPTTDIHAEYMKQGPIGIRDRTGGPGWFCTKDGRTVSDTPYGKVTVLGQDSFTVEDGSSHPYDECDIHTGCARAAFDQVNYKWRCFDEEDFPASSLSPSDFAYQARVAASVMYSGPGKGDTTSYHLFDTGLNDKADDDEVKDNNGFFKNIHLATSRDRTAFLWNAGWEGFPKDPVTLLFDTPDGWDSYNLWNVKGKPDGVGYYKAVKNCDDLENCFLQFYCIDDNGDLYHDC